jgi:hypothetical protein
MVPTNCITTTTSIEMRDAVAQLMGAFCESLYVGYIGRLLTIRRQTTSGVCACARRFPHEKYPAKHRACPDVLGVSNTYTSINVLKTQSTSRQLTMTVFSQLSQGGRPIATYVKYARACTLTGTLLKHGEGLLPMK